jgi:hypothetical protein
MKRQQKTAKESLEKAQNDIFTQKTNQVLTITKGVSKDFHGDVAIQVI